MPQKSTFVVLYLTVVFSTGGNPSITSQNNALASEPSSTVDIPKGTATKQQRATNRPIEMSNTKPSEGRFVETADGFMVPYTVTIPGTEATFQMLPVPGGTFLLGSPENEAGRQDDEGPQVRVTVSPFWIARCEVTWGSYKQYMATYEPLKSIHDVRAFLTFKAKNAATQKRIDALKARVHPFPALADHAGRLPTVVDAFTSPTPLYSPDVTFELGEEPTQPAATMTQYAAKQYTKWLSGLTGQTYRLPTEAEWEYAARAGSSTSYSFGDDPNALDGFAWYFDNADDTTHKVGTKKPNAWGIHDMHGNVAEWVLDQHADNHYAKYAHKTTKAEDLVLWPTQEFPRVIRGGSWSGDPEDCRSAMRVKSGIDWSAPPGRSWKEEDPQIPKSPWWFTEPWTQQVGFRIMRPFKPMSAQDKKQCWEADVKTIQDAVIAKIKEGRGATGIADRNLAKAMEEIKQYTDSEEEDEEE